APPLPSTRLPLPPYPPAPSRCCQTARPSRIRRDRRPQRRPPLPALQAARRAYRVCSFARSEFHQLPVSIMSDEKTSNQMWGGRFASGPSAIMEAINASIGFDQKLYAQDIRGSLAHAAMLAKVGIISADDEAKIAEGLKTILREIEAGKIGRAHV